MNIRMLGTVIAVKKQWWLKVNTKPIRKHALDGATFPHIIKVEYAVDGKIYVKKKWLNPGVTPPSIGDFVTVLYDENNPSHAQIIYGIKKLKASTF